MFARYKILPITSSCCIIDLTFEGYHIHITCITENSKLYLNNKNSCLSTVAMFSKVRTNRVVILFTIIFLLYVFVNIKNQDEPIQRVNYFSLKATNFSSMARETPSHLNNTILHDGMFIKFGLSHKEKAVEQKMYNLHIQYMHNISTQMIWNPFIFQRQTRNTIIRMILGI